MCQDVHMFSYQEHAGVKFPSSRLDSCQTFRNLDPERRAAVLEEQSGCSICTSFTHKKLRQHVQGNRRQQGVWPRAPPHAGPVKEQLLPGNVHAHIPVPGGYLRGTCARPNKTGGSIS